MGDSKKKEGIKFIVSVDSVVRLVKLHKLTLQEAVDELLGAIRHDLLESETTAEFRKQARLGFPNIE